MLEWILQQFDVTRQYTRMVLAQVPHERWCEIPAGCPSHVTWQVGHIAVSQAGLCWRTVCGREMTQIISDDHVQRFGKGSVPQSDAGLYPDPVAVTRFMEDVQVRVLDALRALAPAALEESASHATGLIHTKGDLLMWAVRHEMLHVGQIGLIRRLFGELPYR